MLVSGCGRSNTQGPSPSVADAPSSNRSAVLAETTGSEPTHPVEKQQAPSKKADFRFTTAVLMKAFETDKSAAMKKYNNSVVEVEGILDDPHGGNLPEHPMVGYKTEKPGQILICELTRAYGQKTNDLTVGQKIRLNGILVADNFPTVYVMECEIIEAGPNPAIPVTAAELARAYSDDEASAGKRFGDKQLIVEGVVTGVLTGEEFPNPVVLLEGAAGKSGKKLVVYSEAHHNHNKEFLNLKKGQKVKVKGHRGTVLVGKGWIGDEDGVGIASGVIVK
jgi:hypothetical protein